jgi:hypothetical protein
MRVRAALIALPILLAILLAVQLNVLADRLAAAATGVALCTTGALHTSEEPPDLPLTRDYALLRVLLKDPAGQFEHMRWLYNGALRAPKTEPVSGFLGKRTEPLTLAHDLHAPQSLRAVAERIDHHRGTRIATTIEQGLVERNRAAIEAGFRQMFAVLVDETLAGIQARLGQSGVARSFQYVRRFYSSGLEAHLGRKRRARRHEPLPRNAQSRKCGRTFRSRAAAAHSGCERSDRALIPVHAARARLIPRATTRRNRSG